MTTTTEDRCDWSDLLRDECGHCTGAAPMDIKPNPLIRGTRLRGKVIWPKPEIEMPDSINLPGTWLPENPDANECRCGRPTRDSAYLCDHCADLLARALGDVPWTIEQLDISIAGQRAATTSGGSASADHGLPWHERAAEAKRALHSILATWVRWCIEERIRSSDPGSAWPADQAEAMSRWLLWRVDGLTLHETGPDAVEQITDAVIEARRIILWKRRSRVYLGRCEGQIVDDGTEPLEVECPGDVYAEEGRDTGECVECQRAYSVTDKRGSMERDLDDRLFTAAEIAHLSTFLGLDVPRERVRKQVGLWAHRGRITPGGHNEAGDPIYRYGAVKSLLYATYAATARDA